MMRIVVALGNGPQVGLLPPLLSSDKAANPQGSVSSQMPRSFLRAVPEHAFDQIGRKPANAQLPQSKPPETSVQTNLYQCRMMMAVQ
jgi:carbamate kinase